MLRRVVIGRLVEKVGAVREDEEAVGKSGWNPQLPMIVSAQFDADPAAERWRRFSQINRCVKYPSGHDPDEFSLGPLNLVVKAAQHAAPRTRVIVLHEG